MIFSLEDPLSYKNPEALIKLVSDVVSVLSKYSGRENFTFASDIVNWLKLALSRFGYTMRIYRQDSVDEDFVNICEKLNKLGFILDKEDI